MPGGFTVPKSVRRHCLHLRRGAIQVMSWEFTRITRANSRTTSPAESAKRVLPPLRREGLRGL
jgi:hypothetical protein